MNPNMPNKMDIFSNIKSTFQDFDHTVSTHGKSFQSAVLIPLVSIEGKIHLIYQYRASTLSVQPNEISFPGGKREKQDKNFQETALRETCEELGISRDNIEILAEMDTFITPFNIIIFPFLGIIKDYDKIQINPAEVDHIFTVPLEYFLNHEPERYDIKVNLTADDSFPYERMASGNEYRFKQGSYDSLFYYYKDYSIWGITAKITHDFITHYKELLNQSEEK